MRETLTNARKKASLTQREAAQILGITERQYNRLEAGTSDGSMKIWKRLRKLLGISIDDLLEQVDEK